MRFSLRRLLMFVAIICTALVLVSDWIDPFNDSAFTPTSWRQADSDETRARMARDLIRNHLPQGTSETQTIAALGPPDEILSGEDNDRHSLLVARTYSYYIGSWSLYGMDDAFIY